VQMSLLFKGYTATHNCDHGGGGSNYLCLPESPQWRNHTNSNPPSGWIFGTEYHVSGDHASFFSTVNNGGHQIHRGPASCAVCYVPRRSASVMIPASTSCPVGWTLEYGGYLMSEHSYDDNSGRPRHPANYICVDQAPEVATGGVRQHESYLLTVKVGCGTLPCTTYPRGWELACVVCTK